MNGLEISEEMQRYHKGSDGGVQDATPPEGQAHPSEHEVFGEVCGHH